MTADLGKYTDLHIFKEAFPDRYYQMGMAEQLLFGAAVGLAHEGFMPFATTTYAVFARAVPTTSSTRRSPRRTST
jgi:transketolase